MRPGHPLGAANRIALDQAVDDLDPAGERYAVHGLHLQRTCIYIYIRGGGCQWKYIQMDFRQATDGLCEKIDHDDVAKALGVSVQTVRQARLGASTKAHRQPPREWRDALIRLAEERVWHYRKLIEEIRRERREIRP
jgi:hypothetical protein